MEKPIDLLIFVKPSKNDLCEPLVHFSFGGDTYCLFRFSYVL